jgi:hypothetical protein
MTGGIGEALILEIAAALIVKCVVLGVHIVNDARVYAKEGQQFTLRLQVQIRIWRAIETKVKDPEIQRRIRNEDLILYYRVMKELLDLLRKYIERKMETGLDKTKLLNETSADDLLKKVEDQDMFGKITAKEEVQSSSFWWRFKEEVAHTVLKKARSERLVTEVEAWGDRLRKLASWTTLC